MHKPETVRENETHLILSDFDVQMTRSQPEDQARDN